MTRRLLLTLAALAVVLAGCGDDDDTAGAADDTTSTTEAPDPSAAEDGDDTGSTVSIADFTFDPGTVEVPAGTTVTWTNDDGVGHTVTAGTPDAPEDAFDERLDPGGEGEVSFDEPGTFTYFCAIHPSMTGEVVVS